jgi:serine/threonine protein kinase
MTMKPCLDQDEIKTIGKYTIYEKYQIYMYDKLYLAKSNNSDKCFVIKCFTKQEFIQSIAAHSYIVSTQINDIIEHSRCRTLSKLEDAIKSDKGVYFVFEYNGTPLISHINKMGGRLQEKESIKIIRDVCNAYYHLNSNRIIHRDIKLDNIYINQNGVVLGNYDFAQYFPDAQNGTQIKSNQMKGTPLYMSPEMLAGRDYSYKTDIFSIGVTYYVMLFGHFPFPMQSLVKLSQKYSTNSPIEFPHSVPITKHSVDFIKRCMAYNPADRISIFEIIQHPLILLPYPVLFSDSE